AIQDLTKAIQLDPNVARIYGNRGAAHYFQGNNAQAIQDLTKAIQLDPNVAIFYNNRGFAHDRQGNHLQAIQDYTEAIRKNPASRDELTPYLTEATRKTRKSLQQRLDLCYPDGLPDLVSKKAAEFNDPIHRGLMDDPRVLDCGDSFDRVSLDKLKKTNRDECPCCRGKITFDGRPPNNYLRGKTIDFVEQ